MTETGTTAGGDTGEEAQGKEGPVCHAVYVSRLNGARLTADAQETYDFVVSLYDANQFSFVKLVPWLRDHVA